MARNHDGGPSPRLLALLVDSIASAARDRSSLRAIITDEEPDPRLAWVLHRDIKAKSGHEPLRILVIDRNPERAGVVERALKESGDYLVEISPGAVHLLELLRIMQPDVLIVALDLPDRDTIEQLRVATSEMPRPIVMFVDQSDTETMRAAVSAGVSAYVVDGLQARRVKPILDVAVARFQEFEALRRELELAKTSLAERKLIDRAKGILMRARGLSEDEAYGLLRRKAMHDQKKVIEIAQSVITAAELLK